MAIHGCSGLMITANLPIWIWKEGKKFFRLERDSYSSEQILIPPGGANSYYRRCMNSYSSRGGGGEFLFLQGGEFLFHGVNYYSKTQS